MNKNSLQTKSFFSLLIISLLLTGQINPALAGPSTPNFAIPDGEWEGTLHASYEYEIQGTVGGVWIWQGDMHFFSTAGELTGESVVAGNGSGESSTALALASFNAQVAIFGSSFEPEFQATGGSFDITASSEGFTTDLSFPIDPSTSIPVPVRLISVTCSQASGDWDEFTQQLAASVGGTLTNLTTIFAAVRTADLAPEGQTSYQDELNDLVARANQFLANVKANSIIDQNEFQSILTKAEELALSLRKNNECGFTEEWSFSLPIASLVSQLIDFAANNPDYFSNYEIFLLTETALRAGVIGAGAVNPTLDAEVKSKLGALLGTKMDDLDAAGGNCQSLMPLWVASNSVGDAAKTQAGALFTKYGC